MLLMLLLAVFFLWSLTDPLLLDLLLALGNAVQPLAITCLTVPRVWFQIMLLLPLLLFLSLLLLQLLFCVYIFSLSHSVYEGGQLVC